MSAATTASFRSRVLAGETLFGLFLDLGSPLSSELCANAGYDWLLIDLEHGDATESDLVGLIHAVKSGGAAALVRPQSGERMRIGRPLDLGATGIMVPRLTSAAEAAEAMTFLRYPPAGTRGIATRVRGADLGAFGHDKLAHVNDRIVGIIQIETLGALGEVDAIAATAGVDVLFVGPADLTHALRVPGQFEDPGYLAALDSVVAACQKHGKAPGILLYDLSIVPRYIERGFRVVGIGSDGALIGAGAKRTLATIRG